MTEKLDQQSIRMSRKPGGGSCNVEDDTHHDVSLPLQKEDPYAPKTLRSHNEERLNEEKRASSVRQEELLFYSTRLLSCRKKYSPSLQKVKPEAGCRKMKNI
jgi:hypothetical protein